MAPVAVRAAFWVKESFSAGRAKSPMPARTRAHFITGALEYVAVRLVVFIHNNNNNNRKLRRSEGGVGKACATERGDTGAF